MGFFVITLSLLTFIPTVGVFRRILQKGTSKEIRIMIFKRHFIFSFVFFFIIVEYILKFLKNDDYTKEKTVFFFWNTKSNNVWIGYLLDIFIFRLNGFYLAIIRLIEPFFLESIKTYFEEF